MERFRVKRGAAEQCLAKEKADSTFYELVKRLEGRALEFVQAKDNEVILRLPPELITSYENHVITLISLPRTMVVPAE